ncbi:DUF4177 domain-containing protein [Primorskyibacter sp. S87]|uniref:DUF4177 domain-containing protein n=1 Tax=Primorskyibacter sp. S87 TaxID=3415126 RepID=UPI003C7A784B
MPRYEYKVVPAPQKGTKARKVKTPEARFSLSIENLLNKMGAEGWEYQRAELLPSDERTGLTGSATNWRNVLIFRRAIDTVEDFSPEVIDLPEPLAELPAVAAPAPISESVDEPPIHSDQDAPELEEPENTTEGTDETDDPEQTEDVQPTFRRRSRSDDASDDSDDPDQDKTDKS